MSPLILVGITIISTALGDVKHVLDGTAHPPNARAQEINNLAHNANLAFQTGNPQDFWWMASNSPLKDAYDHYKKCSLKGNCGNVAIAKAVASEGASVSASAAAGVPFSPIDIKNNPFLNGVYEKNKASSGATKNSGFHTGASLDLSNNPFINGKYATNSVGEKIFNENGFIGVQPSKPFATNHPLSQKKPFATTHPLANATNVSDNKNEGALCKGQGNICVKASNCQNGIVANGEGILQVRSDVQICHKDEVCCRLASAGPAPDQVQLNIPTLDGKPTFNNLNHVTAGKSSVLGSSNKLEGGLSIEPQLNFNGESGQHSQSTLKPRDVSSFGSSTPDYSNVDFGDVRFASTIQGPAYLPPVEESRDKTTVVCGFGQIRGPNGICTYPPTTPRPSCGPGQIQLPSGGCGYPSTPKPTCAPGQIQTPFGCQNPTTPRPTCAPGQIQLPSGGCGYPTTPRPTCAPGQIQLPSGGCGYPTTPRPTCAPGQIQLPSGGCGYPTTPRPTCAPGQIQLPSGGCGYPTTPRPTCAPGQIQLPSGGCGYPTTPRPTCAPGQIQLPNGQCGYPTTPRPTCAPGQIQLPSGGCGYPTTPRPTCAPGQIQLPSGGCGYPTTPRPSCGPGQILSPSGSCIYPPTTPQPCAPGQTRNFQGICEYPRTTPRPSTDRGYLPPKEPSSPGYQYPTPTPSFTYPSHIPDGNVPVTVIVNTPTTPPTTGERIEGSPGGHTETRIPPPSENNPRPPPPSCAAALKCVQEIYCTADGFVSPVPVVLTKEQELLRVPTTECSDQESGIIGKCCRDPNYKDPWPSANLVNGVDDGQYKEDNHFGESTNRLVRSNSGPVATRSINSSPSVPQQLVPSASANQCGVRNLNTQPAGQAPIDANFAEIPWQAMILRESNRSLLCGGAIIGLNAVLTTAHCVEGLPTSDILIKGGEWKLGIDEEPLPFQIVKVAAIVRHPQYVHGSFLNDLAVLILEEKLRPAKNIGTLCLPQPNQIPTQNCIATGWGKRILQLHAKNALMHAIDVKIMDSQQCEQTLKEKFAESVQHYSPNTLCGFSNIDQCKVDYGSALACDNGNGHYVLSGIYGWDTGCKQEGQIGGYVAPDVEWIQGCLSKPLNELKKLDSEYTSKASN
ncbi:uncharacterized protein LOC109605766 isoform X2 [Aethina tumida]|uniref:uncharacterized protein LOC109605766 isoform X2 n=1 Tax=Aethina tumida TaxID=116153 RepID=UPI0021486697|nr:uncharacterized protein LOC109605766 isoform X2 [Aethina tumida]